MTGVGRGCSTRWTRSATIAVTACAVAAALAGCGDDHGSGAPATTSSAAGASGASVAGGSASGDTCPSGGPSAGPLALVVGAHENIPEPDVPAEVACLLTATIAAGQAVTVVAVDGRPQELLHATRFELSTANDAAHDDDLNAAFNTVVGVVRSASAQRDGSDLTGAIGIAVDALRSAGSVVQASPAASPTASRGGQGEVVVLDSGLSDRGELAFTEPGMLGADPRQVADAVAPRLPSLRGLRVILVGFGYASPPQDMLNSDQRRSVTDIWSAVLGRAGADVHVLPVPRTGAGLRTGHPVHPVAVQTGPFQPCGLTVLTDASPVAFDAGSSTPRNRPAALAALRPLAAWLIADRTRHVSLTGTSSSEGDRDTNLALSVNRAVGVRSLLIDLGVAAGQISVDGKGYIARPPDHRPGGPLDPAAATLNRSVRIDTGPC